MAEINDVMGLILPDEISDPYKALKKRFNGLLKYTRTPEENIHRIIANTIKTLLRRIANLNDLPETQDTVLAVPIPLQQVPLQLVADFALRQGDYDKAIRILAQYLHHQVLPDSQAIELSVKCLEKKWDANLANLVEKIITSSPKNYVDSINNLLVAYILQRQFNSSKNICQSFDFIIEDTKIFNDDFAQYFLINYAQVFIHMKDSLPDNLRNLLQTVYDTTKFPLARMGAAIVLGNVVSDSQEAYFKESVKILNEDDGSESGMSRWPIFWLLPDECKNNTKLFHKQL